jgi:hypothetical protein
MDVADGRTDLTVAVPVDLFLKEINQATIALKDRQHSEVRARGRLGKEWLDPRREIGFGENSP